MFVAAALLTMWITEVEGRLPFGTPNATIDLKNPLPIQSAAIYVDRPSVELARQISVSYDTLRAGGAAVTLFFPGGDFKARILIDQLGSAKSCTSPRTADEVLQSDIQGGGIHVSTAAHDTRTTPSLYLVEVDPSASQYYVRCEVASVATRHTFTKRAVEVQFVLADPFYPETSKVLTGFVPLPGLLFAFGSIEGAENFSFLGGYPERDILDAESSRALAPGAITTAVWSDVYREQIRDIILVVIGTLIGIGVTMLIEGLRPLIEREPTPADRLATDSAGADGDNNASIESPNTG
jgi:hypothetical protein